ncbi:flavodoxin [Asticcacaulis sp. BYS171W]|uniref:Flavodoxin n=1 Tax=Asticcacaulis aquaticus TaxID=2984212 RepID=A0ABT5HVW8_9CAUL|nr:flavodoxin [Asticcacaulis aquaticus]MDC7684241.1 flavodoxin [Asticcacaulis aquaticus]
MTDLSRRALLTMPIVLSACSPVASEASDMPKSKILVAVFTRSGNTKVIAGTVQRDLSADLFEIQPKTPYPDDYEATVEQARIERDKDIEPPLLRTVTDFDRYGKIYLAFPIWGETAPPIIRSFLKTHDTSGKIIRPIITHGGYGLGNSLIMLKTHAPNAQIEPPFVMEADQERRTLTQVRVWLGQLAEN